MGRCGRKTIASDLTKGVIRTTIAFDADFIDRVKDYAKERQISYVTLLRMLCAERFIQLENQRRDSL